MAKLLWPPRPFAPDLVQSACKTGLFDLKTVHFRVYSWVKGVPPYGPCKEVLCFQLFDREQVQQVLCYEQLGHRIQTAKGLLARGPKDQATPSSQNRSLGTPAGNKGTRKQGPKYPNPKSRDRVRTRRCKTPRSGLVLRLLGIVCAGRGKLSARRREEISDPGHADG